MKGKKQAMLPMHPVHPIPSIPCKPIEPAESTNNGWEKTREFFKMKEKQDCLVFWRHLPGSN